MTSLKAKTLFYNGRIHTQADGLIVDSMALYKNRIVAIGNKLQHDSDFSGYDKINLKGRCIIPGLVDAHTHFHYFARSLGKVDLDGVDSLDKCLSRIKNFAPTVKRDSWVTGGGYSPDRFRKRIEPDRFMLDKVTGDRPAFIFSKDQHTAWVNSKALSMAGITRQD